MVRYAFIPARAGSKRLPGKNTKILNGHPLLAYSIAAAQEAKCFDKILVSTDSVDMANIARSYGAIPFLNDPERHSDEAPDFAWIERVSRIAGSCDAFSILRPTSPFRLGSTIANAWTVFETSGADSLRAVRPVSEHPGKMWVIRHNRLLPLLPWVDGRQPWHSRPTQTLPPVYVQTSALEWAWTARTIKRGSIAGEWLVPFEMSDEEGLSIDTLADWEQAEAWVTAGVLMPTPHKSEGT